MEAPQGLFTTSRGDSSPGGPAQIWVDTGVYPYILHPFVIDELTFVQFAVEARLGQQIFMDALFDDTAVPLHHGHVRWF